MKVGTVLNASAAASDNAGVARVEFWLDGVLKATDTTAPYSAAIAMGGFAQGSAHTLTARAYDTSGRIADASSTVTVDKVVNLTLGAVPEYTNATTVPLSIGTDPDASMKCSLNGGPASTCASTYSPLSSPADGTYTYTVTATDDVGNVASGTRTFTVDRTAPAASFTDGPTEGAIVGSGPISFKFGYTDLTPTTVTCSLDGAAFAACDSADSQTLGGLAAGSNHTFTVKFVDSAGNVTQLVRHFSVAATPPSGTGTGTGSGSGGSGTGGGGSQVVLGAGPTASKAKLSSRFKVKGKNTLVRKLVLTGVP
ncbi:MAG TPA: Ig-like domain-containing protein, partial [Thermoleophilaceae bacterium]|nr:Ig-like domain-containing protein [Thermoleophilaceae bacterium]